MDRRSFVATVCGSTAALAGCLSRLSSERTVTPLPTVPGGTWTQHGADSANTFTADVAAPARGNLAWTSKAFTQWEPVLAEGTVYTTNFDPSNEGSAIALDAQDGSEQWRTTIGTRQDNSSQNARVLVDGRFIVAHDRTLIALAAEDGEVMWRRSIEGLPPAGEPTDFGTLLAADSRTGTVIAPYRHVLKAFRAEDGERRWDTTTVTELAQPPAIQDGTVYALGRIDGVMALAAIALDDGTTRWTTPLDAPLLSAAPVATDHGVFVIAGNALAVHDRATGATRTTIPLAETDELRGEATIAADSETAFVAHDTSGLLAVDVAAGTTRVLHDDWIAATGFCVDTETVVAVVDGSQYVSATHRDTITAFDRETGNARWNYTLARYHSLTIPPILADGAVFFATSQLDALAALGDVPPAE